MLINNWLVIDSFKNVAPKDWRDGFCLELSHDLGGMRDSYLILQRLPVESPFAILFSKKNSWAQKVNESYIESIISLFFQPSYFLANDRPVVFLSDSAADNAWFIEKLSEKCRMQGLALVILNTKDAAGINNSGDQFAYEVTSSDIDYGAIVENWLSQYLEGRYPAEVHFLFRRNEPGPTEILHKMQQKEMVLQNTQHYRFANLAYQKQRLIEKYKKELDLKVSGEKNTQLYLSMQKKQTADNVEWYHHEYEILPAWYKRLGHIIKVLTGKRTFRSLFSDKVKKYRE